MNALKTLRIFFIVLRQKLFSSIKRIKFISETLEIPIFARNKYLRGALYCWIMFLLFAVFCGGYFLLNAIMNPSPVVVNPNIMQVRKDLSIEGRTFFCLLLKRITPWESFLIDRNGSSFYNELPSTIGVSFAPFQGQSERIYTYIGIDQSITTQYKWSQDLRGEWKNTIWAASYKTLHIDNATELPVNLSVDSISLPQLDAKSYGLVKIEIGTHKLEAFNIKDQKSIDACDLLIENDDAVFIYNIAAQNTYFVRSANYSKK
jgi:hypothetical protein